MNAKQRKRERSEKELLILGRDAKQVRANATSMEEQVRASAKTIGELQAKVSQLEIDRDSWRGQAINNEEARANTADTLSRVIGDGAALSRQLADKTGEVACLKDRVVELEEGLREMPKLRRRLQERAIEVADLEKKVRGLEALLKRHEREAASEAAMIAGAKAGL